jgi:hypothetical protein
LTTCAFSLAPGARPSQVLVASLVHAHRGDDVVAVHDDAVDVDHQYLHLLQAALVERGQLRRAGLDEAPRHRTLGHAHRAGSFGQDLRIAPRGHAGHHDVAHAFANVGVVELPVSRHADFMACLVAQPRALHAQLALGQRHHAALRAVPQHRPTVAPTLLGACELLRRQHQQLLDQRHGAVVHQLVDAGLRALDQLEHRQQRLAAASQHPGDLRAVVAVHDIQCRLACLCLTILHGGFLRFFS